MKNFRPLPFVLILCFFSPLLSYGSSRPSVSTRNRERIGNETVPNQRKPWTIKSITNAFGILSTEDYECVEEATIDMIDFMENEVVTSVVGENIEVILQKKNLSTGIITTTFNIQYRGAWSDEQVEVISDPNDSCEEVSARVTVPSQPIVIDHGE